jgi:ribosomal protein L40E
MTMYISWSPYYEGLIADVTSGKTNYGPTLAACNFYIDISYNPLASRFNITGSGSFSVNLDTSQNPYGIFVIAPLTNTPPVATETVSPVSGVYTGTATALIPEASTAPLTRTLTFATTLQVPFMQTYGGWVVAAIIGVLVIVVLFFALQKRRTTHRPKQATLSQFVNVPTSCIKCGAALPPASEFCNKCGTKQTS